MSKSISVFAVDVGYGNVKSAYRLTDGQLVTNIFPALAPMHVKSTISSHAEENSRNTVVIKVDGAKYEVGPDVRRVVTSMNAGHNLSDDYAKSPGHVALLFGAIALSGADRIECLSLGLPVHIINQAVKGSGDKTPVGVVSILKEKFAGTHEINGKKVTIDRVAVIPQPMGSLFWHKKITSDTKVPAGNVSLIIDVGYYSTDWIVAEGWNTIDERSGGRRGGAFEIYSKIATSISDSEGEIYTDVRRIDEALRNGMPLSFYSKPLDLQPLLKQADGIIAEVINGIKTKIQSAVDVSEIILTGGGAAFYKDGIAQNFKNKLVLMDDACYTNVKGFLISGDGVLLRAKKAV